LAKRSDIIAIFTLASLGSIAKIFGGIEFGSRALFIDALTCIANLVALALTTHFLRLSLAPPDEDHPYGHYRVALGGPFSTLLAYSFIGGIAVTELINVEPYRVSIYAAICAGLGLLLYLGAILRARSVGGALSTYAVFTWTEVFESSITIGAAVGGALLSYVIDYAGAIAITTFIFYELIKEGREFLTIISDITHPELVYKISRDLERHGFKVKYVRIRRVSHNVYQGDVTIVLDPSISLDEAHRIADKVERLLKEKYGVEVVVHVEPARSSKTR